MAVVRYKRRVRRPCLLRRLLAGLFTLVLAAIGLSIFLVLPWRWLPPPSSSFMLQTYFATEGVQTPYQYQWQPYRLISPYAPLAAIAAEDQRFPTHAGFDLTELERAVEDYQNGEELRGASTITQQVAKNLYLWSGRSLLRKGLEAWFTVLIEWLWSKQRILEVYLNIAQFGPALFGVEAGSQQFFGISANDLTAEEAAALAAALPAPELYQVNPPSIEVQQRQAWILSQMQQLGGLDYLQTLEPSEPSD
jgi:monofunctional glycosyltransferase